MQLSGQNLKFGVLALLVLYLATRLPRTYRKIRRTGILTYLKVKLLRIALRFPKYRKQLDSLQSEGRLAFQRDLLKHREDPTLELPLEGIPSSVLLERTKKWADRDKHLQNGKLSGSIYHGGEELSAFLASVMSNYVISNTLHPDVFPSVRQMESEIVQITLNLFNAPDEACGALTSGGTESILLAMLAYREWGRARGISEPEIIVGVTAHVAFAKAAHYFGMTLVEVPVDKNQQMDLRKVRQEVNGNTVVIVGSAPCYSSGIVDPLEALGKLAIRSRTNFHIDACLGGYLLPFVEAAGHEPVVADFRVPGVTSISCDPHKYGYTPKGVSVVMYIKPDLRKLQYFGSPNWVGGAYITPCIGGSRPGVNSVGGWASILSFGKEGYTNCAKQILDAAQKIKAAINSTPELQLLGDPKLSVIAFTSDLFNVHVLAGEMQKSYGWTLNCLLSPRGAHLCVTYSNCHQADDFIESLKKGIEVMKQNPDTSNYEVATFYGYAAQVPDTKVTSEFLYDYVDCLYHA